MSSSLAFRSSASRSPSHSFFLLLFSLPDLAQASAFFSAHAAAAPRCPPPSFTAAFSDLAFAFSFQVHQRPARDVFDRFPFSRQLPARGEPRGFDALLRRRLSCASSSSSKRRRRRRRRREEDDDDGGMVLRVPKSLSAKTISSQSKSNTREKVTLTTKGCFQPPSRKFI